MRAWGGGLGNRLLGHSPHALGGSLLLTGVSAPARHPRPRPGSFAPLWARDTSAPCTWPSLTGCP